MPSALPSSNILVNVPTYQKSEIGALYNVNPFVQTANKKFQNFQDLVAQKGTTVNFDLPPRFVGVNSLVANFEPAVQLLQPLVVNNEFSISLSVSAQQLMFNVDDYMDRFGMSAVRRIGSEIGTSIAQNGVDHTYRCFGDGRTAINSFQQYAQALANFRDYGDPGYPTRAYVDMVQMPAVIGSGLNQFVASRNEEMANTWQMGDFAEASFYKTNLLQTHLSGAFGHDDQTALALTVTAISPDGTSITFSSTGGTESVAFRNGDILTFDPNGVAGLYYLRFLDYHTSSQKVQVRVTADAASVGGAVTVSVFPALVSVIDQPLNNTANINIPLASMVGVTATVTGDHKAGFICGGDALFLAMPRLVEPVPFPASNAIDEFSGISLRLYYGTVFGQNIQGLIHDVIWGSTLVDQNAMRIAYPLTT